MMDVRSPAVAGQFYAGTEEGLRRQIEECYTHEHGPGEVPTPETGPRRLVGLVSPHAGYPYSGPVAAHGFHRLASDGAPDSVVIIGPNHHGIGSGVSVAPPGEWMTPFGKIEVDADLAAKIKEASTIIDEDSVAHSREHSIEVQLPFLQHLFGDQFKIAPICMMMQDEETSEEVGHAIAEASTNEDVLVIASTDFTHYEFQESATSKDKKAIEKITALDWRGLMQVVSRENISMCGYGPVSAMIVASKDLGARSAELLKYATSGDTAGPSGQVVGYGSIAVTKSSAGD